MKRTLRRLSAAEHTAGYLRDAIRAGRWVDKLPGVLALAAECDVSTLTLRRAFRILEAERLIATAGAGRCRKVAGTGIGLHELRVMILLDLPQDAIDAGFQVFLFQLQQDLVAAGHHCGFAQKSQAELKNSVARIARQVNATPADAWVVAGGTKETLTWFAGQKVPAIAIGGKCSDVAMAGTALSHISVYRTAIPRLIELGHRRIVMLSPLCGRPSERHMLGQEFGPLGLTVTDYNVPEWDETAGGLHQQLEKTFHLTPPTAIIITYTNWMVAVLAFLAQRKLRVPQDVSVFCLNFESWFTWHRPAIAHMYSDGSQMARRIVRWVNAAACGRQDRKYVSYPAEFVVGESLGPASTYT